MIYNFVVVGVGVGGGDSKDVERANRVLGDSCYAQATLKRA